MTDTNIAGAAPASPAHGLPPGLVRSPAAKFFLTGLITVMLIIPLWMVLALTSERESRRDEVAYAIGQEWGQPQSVDGPLLVIPYLARVTGENNETVLARRHLVVLPDTLSASVDAATEERNVSIYEVPVYSSHIVAKGRFRAIDTALFGSDLSSVLWDEAFVSIAVDDLTGIEDAALSVDGRTLVFEPGAARDGSFPMVDGGTVRIGPGVHAPLGVTGPVAGFDFALDLRLRGTDLLAIAPVGRQSEVTMTSNWPHPNFAIGMLPSERSISAERLRPPPGACPTWPGRHRRAGSWNATAITVSARTWSASASSSRSISMPSSSAR